MPSADMHTGEIICAIERLDLGEIRLMEVCGTHTMSIAKSGLRSMLPKNIKLLSGPGCPVCVTPPEVIDAVLELAMEKDVIITTYGDMLRVPGSTPGDSLQRRRAMGARVQMVYSPVDAVQLAKENPDKQVVFLGVGFETTAPGTAAADRAWSCGQFAKDAKIVAQKVKAKTRATAGHPAVEKDAVAFDIPPALAVAGARPHEFEILAKGAEGRTAVFHVVANGFNHARSHKRASAPTAFKVALDRLPAGTAALEVRPLDCWWNKGEPLAVTI